MTPKSPLSLTNLISGLTNQDSPIGTHTMAYCRAGYHPTSIKGGTSTPWWYKGHGLCFVSWNLFISSSNISYSFVVQLSSTNKMLCLYIPPTKLSALYCDPSLKVTFTNSCLKCTLYIYDILNSFLNIPISTLWKSIV